MGSSIEIGFSNNIYDNPADVVGSVGLISRDFRAIEIELAEEAQPAVFEAAPEEYARIVAGLRALASEHGLRYAIHAAWHGPYTDLTSPDANERGASVDLLTKSIQFAADIGAKVVTCHPGYRHKCTEEELLENIIDSLDRVKEPVAKNELTLCVENMGAERPAHALFEDRHLFELCERARVSLCLDIVHLASVHPDTAELLSAVKRLAPIVRHVHLADTIRPRHKHLPIGQGDLPLQAILKELESNGYHGPAIVEEFNRGWTPEQYLTGALAFRERMKALAMGA